ncbi:sensor histidine kinase [Streptomyces sp. NPDC048172]|uniref:sensor histidine kinase n=1 Tax=Streptomyces sp. NPDC048172 TaxID=3365505 RepID=UPI003721BDBE
MRALLLRWFKIALGLALGVLTAVGGLLFLLAAALFPPVRRRAPALAAVERRRIAGCYDTELGPVPPSPHRALGFLTARLGPGLLGGLVLFAGVIGAGYGSLVLWGWLLLTIHDPLNVFWSACAGLFLLFLSVQGMYGVALLEIRTARRFCGPDDRAELVRRIGELAESRAGVVEAVHDERRRIERDLHDGVQQRLVALGLVLGRARRSGDPAKADALLGQAHEEAQRALEELREVAWRVYPATLDEGGLGAALETVAERAGIAGVPVRLSVDLAAEPPDAVRAMAYFVAAEAVTNAVKHAGASAVTLTVTSSGTLVTVRTEDDGRGGADPAGGGLTGLSRRVSALDGRFSVDSPVGGPTLITAELPCA